MDRGGRRGNSEALARNYSDCEALLITETKAKEPRRCCCERRWRDIELLGPLPVAAGARGTFREVRGDSSWFVR